MKDVPQYEAMYVAGYEKHNVDRTLAGRFLQKSHSLLEDSLPKDFKASRVLEVGAGSGHHYAFLHDKPAEYVLTRYAKEVASGVLSIEKQDATRLRFPDGSFDRLIATHVLEHIPNPVAALREWDRVVKKGGLLSIVLPCDPGVLWRFGRNFGPRRNAKKMDLPYDYLQAAEHVNSIYNLVVFIRHHFDHVSESWYPLRVPLPDVNLFYIGHIRTE